MPFDIGGFIYNSDRIENDARAGIVTNGLILHLDAGIPESYPLSGNGWFDLSGNGNHFTLFNSPSFNKVSNHIFFDGTNSWAKSSNTINLTNTNTITVEIGYRVPTITTNVMAFEFTPNWNTNSGAFGAFTNSGGGLANSPDTDNRIHTNSNAGVCDFVVPNITTNAMYHFVYESGYGADLYYNSTLANKVRNENVRSFSNFANSDLYIGSRAGTGGFGEYFLFFIKIYDRRLSQAEITHNYNVTKNRFGL